MVVEDEPELEVDDPDPEGDVLELELLLDEGAELDEELVVGVDDVVDTGAHDSLSDTTTPWIGRFMAEIGVPGATLTLNV